MRGDGISVDVLIYKFAVLNMCVTAGGLLIYQTCEQTRERGAEETSRPSCFGEWHESISVCQQSLQ